VWFASLCVTFIALALHAWSRRSILSRLAGVGLALAMLLFASPNLYRALRGTALLPERDRVVSNLWTRRAASPYESVAALTVLAAVPPLPPWLRRTRRPSDATSERPPAAEAARREGSYPCWLPNERGS
jgi:hypothetical protein